MSLLDNIDQQLYDPIVFSSEDEMEEEALEEFSLDESEEHNRSLIPLEHTMMNPRNTTL